MRDGARRREMRANEHQETASQETLCTVDGLFELVRCDAKSNHNNKDALRSVPKNISHDATISLQTQLVLFLPLNHPLISSVVELYNYMRAH